MAQRRSVIERTFRLLIRDEVQAVRPPWLTSRDSASIVRHVENHRKDVVEFSKLRVVYDESTLCSVEDR